MIAKTHLNCNCIQLAYARQTSRRYHRKGARFADADFLVA